MTIDRKAPADMDFRAVATGRKLAPVHPGEVLMHDFIEPMDLTRYKVAKLANVQQRRIDEICAGKRAITADTALRLAKLLGVDAQIWMNLQAQYDLETTKSALGDRIEKEVLPLQAAAQDKPSFPGIPPGVRVFRPQCAQGQACLRQARSQAERASAAAAAERRKKNRAWRPGFMLMPKRPVRSSCAPRR